MTGGWCRWHCLSHTKNDDFHGGVGPFHARKQISWGPTHLQKGEMPKGSFHLKRDSGNQPCSRGKSRSNLRTSKCNDWGVLFASGWKSKSPAKKTQLWTYLTPYVCLVAGSIIVGKTSGGLLCVEPHQKRITGWNEEIKEKSCLSWSWCTRKRSCTDPSCGTFLPIRSSFWLLRSPFVCPQVFLVFCHCVSRFAKYSYIYQVLRFCTCFCVVVSVI